MSAGAGPAIWVLVLLCGAAAQAIKLAVYSLLAGRPALQVLGRGAGLPSLPAAALTCLTTLMVWRLGWNSGEAGLSMVLSVVVLHDAMRLKKASQAQREVLGDIIESLARQGELRRAVRLLSVRAHRPFHVAVGVLFGLLFALAVGP